MSSEPSELVPSAGQTDATETSGAAVAPLATVSVTKRKKKRKYSRGLKDAQLLGRSVSKASARVARAVAKGMATFRKESDKSARKKRDGALRDFGVNIADGLSTTMRELSAVPTDLAKGLNTKRARRRVRRQVKMTARILRPLA